ncbi:MAG TPA: tetratricopeptide repeat protein [Polyangia bacterium]|nr:tetratricopeptide repeat protein [Polyangia bacterium]
MRALAVLALAPLLCGFAVLEKRDPEIEAGNAALKAGKPDDALAHYDKAAKKLPADAGVHFDRGAALYALSRFDEAGQEFLRATDAKDAALKQSAFYNLGNALFKKEKFKEAVGAYTRALGLRPDDKQAKWNLEIALKKQREDEEKHKNDQKKDDKQDQKKDQQKKDDKQDQQKKDDKQDQKKDQQKKDDKQDQKDAQKPQPQGGDDRQQAEAVLDNLERSAKDLEKERARVRAVRRAPPERDW